MGVTVAAAQEPVVIGRFRYGQLGRRLALVPALILLGPSLVVFGPQAEGGLPAVARLALAGTMVIGGFYGVRAVRAGVTVTDQWIEQRRLCSSWRLPWRWVSHLAASETWFVVAAPHRVHIHRSPPHADGWSPGLREAIRSATWFPMRSPVVIVEPTLSVFGRDFGVASTADGVTCRDYETWPATCAAFWAFGLWLSLVLLAAGVTGEAFVEARAARERFTTAEVLGWQVDDDFPTTVVDVRFETETGLATAQLRRTGEARPAQELVEVRYDPDHPADADFADGPNRRSEAEAADCQVGVGLAGSVLALLALVVTALVARRRRRRDPTRVLR